MAVTLTDAAANRVQSFLANRGKGIGLRVGIKTTGCSGLAYVLEFVDELNDDDETFAAKGVTLIVDAKSLVYIDGTELDYTKEGSVMASSVSAIPMASVRSCSASVIPTKILMRLSANRFLSSSMPMYYHHPRLCSFMVSV